MRLQEVYFICRKSLETWPKIEYSERQSGAATKVIYYSITNPEAIRNTLMPLEVIDPLRATLNKIYNVSPDIQRGIWNTELLAEEKQTLNSAYAEIRRTLKSFCDLCEFLDVPQNADGFDVKLPPDIQLQGISDCINELDSIISLCPLLHQDDCSISFRAVDIGSTWLTFIIIGAGALTLLHNLAALVDKAVIIRSHILTTRAQEEQARRLKLKNDQLETITSVNKQIIKGVAREAAEDLAKEHQIDNPEDKGRLAETLKTLAELMSQGVEIYSSIEASDEIKASFPPLEQQKLPDAAVKLLEEHLEETSTE